MIFGYSHPNGSELRIANKLNSLNCSRRNIGCDGEGYGEGHVPDAAASNSFAMTEAILTLNRTNSGPSEESGSLRVSLSETADYTNEERSLLHHGHQFNEVFRASDALEVAFGISLMPEYVELHNQLLDTSYRLFTGSTE